MSYFILQHHASTVGIQLYTTETQCDNGLKREGGGSPPVRT